MSDEKTTEAKPEKQVPVYHPTLAGVSQVVDASNAAAWQATGWRKTPPKKG